MKIGTKVTVRGKSWIYGVGVIVGFQADKAKVNFYGEISLIPVNKLIAL